MCTAHALVVYDQVLAAKEPKRSIQQRTQFTREGEIYYLLVDDLIKIGFTVDMTRRMPMYPPRAALLAVHPGTMGQEQDLHIRLKEHRAGRREWYVPNAVIRRLIEAVEPAMTPILLSEWCAENRIVSPPRLGEERRSPERLT